MLFVVTGPPAAGKSSWIQAHATARDIVIDLDLIATSLAGPGAAQWNHDPTLLKVAHRARFAAIEEALSHRETVDIYLIHTMPSARALAKYRRYQAQMVTVDPGRDIVMQRIADMRDPAMTAVATRWYREAAKRTSHRTTRQASRSW
ncbi:AAA family ATPase [Streptomyces zaomyceticus]|uniref:AAA family ATPase n=1 Tax=Streptomyces zaomyceticus TaxID=68286 RepID=UPI002E11F9F7|nr:ATP-binding protein [Streptomyces zaomyceticus]